MGWFLAVLLILALGLVFNLGLLVYAMYALLGVMLVSRFLSRRWIENLSAQRECNKLTANIGEKVAVVLTIDNNGGLPVPWVLLEDSLPRDALTQRPPRIKVQGRRFGIMQLRARGRKSLLYQVTFRMRGYYQIGPLLLESGDLFGLHRRYRIVTEPGYVLVYPRIVPLENYNLASRRPIGEIRMTHRLFEDPTRISGVRPYQQGDALNRIHWRATARTGELHSKTYEPSTVAGATFLLDFHRDVYDALGEPHRSDLAVTAIASLANAVYRMGQQIGLITNARDAADRIREEGFRHDFRDRAAARDSVGMATTSDRLRPVVLEAGRGPAQFQQLSETLARVELTDGLTFAQLVSETQSRMPRDATIVAVLPDVPEQTALTLGNLHRQGFAITAIVIVYDDVHYAKCAGRLLAQGIEVRRLENETTLTQMCSQQMVGV